MGIFSPGDMARAVLAKRPKRADGGAVDDQLNKLGSVPPFKLYSGAAKVIGAKGQAKATPQQYAAMPGIKPDELKHSKFDTLGSKALPREEVIKHLEDNALPLEETTYTGDDEQSALRRYGEDKTALPGGQNYREVLLHLPHAPKTDTPAARMSYLRDRMEYSNDATAEDMAEFDRLAAAGHHAHQEPQTAYRSSHWDQPNVLAHVRMSDRRGPNGEKVLHVEEVQSDWGQQGREKGFGKTEPLYEVYNKAGNLERTASSREDAEKHMQRMAARFPHLPSEDIIGGWTIQEKQHAVGPPSAPYVDNTQKWTDLALKRVLHEAAHGGYDKIVVTPGEEQAKRYDLSKQIDALKVYKRHGGDGYNVNAHKDGKMVIMEHAPTDGALAGIVGKDMAKRVLDNMTKLPTGEMAAVMSGADLRLGGEGMKTFYDKMVPQALQKLAKRHDPDAEVKLHAFPLDTRRHDERVGSEKPAKGPHGHSITITPRMRASIMKGQTAFATGGAIVDKALRIARGTGGSLGDPVAASGLQEAIDRTTGLPRAGAPAMGAPIMPGVSGVKTADAPGISTGSIGPGGPVGRGGGWTDGRGGGWTDGPIGGGSGDGNGPGGGEGNGPGGGVGTSAGDAAASASAGVGVGAGDTGVGSGTGETYARGGNIVDQALRIARAGGGPVDLQNLKPTDTGSTSVSELSNAFQKAIDYHTSLTPQARVANSKDAMAKVGNYAGFYKGTTKPFSLLGKNQKLEKTESGYDGAKPVTLPDGRPIAAAGVSLSPAMQFGKFNTCPNHASCKESCLGKTSGGNFLYGGAHDLEAFKGPRLVGLNKTKALVNEPEAFATRLYDEIDARKRLAANQGKHLGVRLNVISDLHPRITQALIKAHPDVSFYDYTKLNSNPVAPNHHLTYSSTGVSQYAGQNGLDHDVENPHSNWRTVRTRLDGGSNVAMAFTHGKHLPETVHDAETGKTYKVIDGDTHDYRPLDAQPKGEDGVVIGLRNKNMTTKSEAASKTAAKNSNGFMVHYDPHLGAEGKGQKSTPTNKTVVIAPQPKRTAGLVGHNGGPPLE